MTTQDMPALPSDLEALFTAERPIPPASEQLQARVLERLAATLQWSGPGPGGAGAMGGLGALLLLALVAVGLVGIGYFALSGDGGIGKGTSTSSPPLPSVRAHHLRAGASSSLPTWFGEAGRPSRSISGHVKFQGKPFAGARVVLQSDMTRASLVDRVETVADTHGWFSFGEQHAAWYDVSASAPGMGFGSVQIATHDPTAIPDHLVIQLSGCDHVLHGFVRDASGGVIVGAQVLPARSQWPLASGVSTDSHGHYELCTRAGKLEAIVSAQGYGAVHIIDTIMGRQQFDIELVPEAIIVGRVVRADDGAPLPDMAIWLYPAAWPERLRSTSALAVSDSQGRFRIDGLSPGRHILYGKSRELSVRPTPVLLDVGQESREVVLRAEPHATLRGKVVQAGKPVPGAKIATLVDGQRRGGYEIADALGEFSLWPVSEGTVQFEVEGYRVVSPLEYECAPSTNAPVTVTVAKEGAIRGQVVFQGTPVYDAEVEASGKDLKAPASARTTEDGTFEVVGLPAGTYVLTASSNAAFAFSTKATSPKITLRSQEIRGDVLIKLDASASIAGSVLDQHDQGLPGVVVQYVDSRTGERCKVTTDQLGTFVCGPLAGGASYLPSVQPDTASTMQFPSASGTHFDTVLLAEGRSQVKEQVLRVQAERQLITGRVVAAEGSGIPDTTVRAIESSTGYTPATAPWLGLRTSISGAGGEFQIAVWAGAHYALHARTPTGGEGIAANIAAGSTGVAIQIEEPGGIEGVLVGFDEPPNLLVRRIGNTVDIVRADVDKSSFSAHGLSPGQYAVMAVSGSRGTAESITVRSGQTTAVTLDAGPAARLTVQVVDFATMQPVEGVRCNAAPFILDAGIFGWGSRLAPPTDSRGRVSFDAPTGAIEISCLPRQLRHSEGAARLNSKPGEENGVTVYVVVSNTPGDSANSIGARFHMGFDDEDGGYTHTLVELRPGGAAEKAGLRVGDVIDKIEGRPVSPITDLELLIGTYGIGATVVLDLHKGKASQIVPVVVEAPWFH